MFNSYLLTSGVLWVLVGNLRERTIWKT